MARDNRRSRDAQDARQTASRGKSQRETRSDNRKPASESDTKALQSQRAPQNSPAETRNRRAKKNNAAKKKVVIKKRFFIFCIIFVLLIAAIIFLSVKTVHNVMMMNNGGEQVTATADMDASEQSEDTGNDDTGDTTAETASTSSGSSTADENGYQPAIMTQDPASEVDEDGNPVEVNLTQEQQIRAAILGSWYISPVAQTREYVESVFGKLTRYEDWNGGAYYHRGFPETMYVNYRGDKGEDDLPTMDSICCTVSVVMKRIIEFEEFKPDAAVWGDVHEDPSSEGWSNYYYYILIKDNMTLKVYCDKDGNINKETHIVVHRL